MRERQSRGNRPRRQLRLDRKIARVEPLTIPLSRNGRGYRGEVIFGWIRTRPSRNPNTGARNATEGVPYSPTVGTASCRSGRADGSQNFFASCGEVPTVRN